MRPEHRVHRRQGIQTMPHPTVRVFTPGVHQIPVAAGQKHATHAPPVAS